MLGFHLGPRPTVSVHVESLRRRFQQRVWILTHLRHSGFNEKELAKVYRVFFLSLVFPSALTLGT